MGIIKFTHLGFRFQSRKEKSLQDINLSVNPGECALLAGRSGSGKSTLLHCLSGLVPEYYQGELFGCIRIGEDEVRWKDVPLWEKSKTVGTVFQDPRHQFFSARVKQELTLSDSALNLKQTLTMLGLEEKQNRLLDTLSSGEQQRVAIGTAMGQDASILVLDEPSANLSADGIAILLRYLKKARANGVTIVIAEHRFSWLEELVDQLLVLDHGKLAYTGDVAALEQKEFCEQYGLRFQPKGLETPVGYAASEEDGSASPRVTFTGLGHRHGKKEDWLWRNMNHQFHGGEVVALTGKNGCGKTTLLNLAFGLQKPAEGDIDFGRESGGKALALQHSDLQLFGSTVIGELNCEPGDAEEWLDRFDLAHLQDRHPLTLSGGEMQRLVLATAFAKVDNDPKAILLLDEPTSGMDGAQLAKLSAEIIKLREKGGLVLMATHDHELLQETGAQIVNLQ